MLYVCENQALLKAVKRWVEVKKMFGDGGGKNYVNSQFSNQNRQDAFSRVSRGREKKSERASDWPMP